MSKRVQDPMGSDDDRTALPNAVARATCNHVIARDADGQCVLCTPRRARVASTTRVPSKAIRDRVRLRRSFADFVAWTWPLVTGFPYVANTISTRIISTLQQVGDGELTRVLIACPPGVGKSTLLACYAAWQRARDPGHQSIHAGHQATLAEKESRRVRRLIEGDEYQQMFPLVKLRSDANTAALWETTSNGHYVAVGVDGGLTGKRAAGGAVVDDGLNAIDRYSKAARDGLWVFFTEGLSSRLDGDNAPMIVVMQRLDRDDLIGRLIEAGGWHLVELPAEEPDGTLNAPNVLSREKLDGLKKQMGAAAYACQYLQEPSDDSNASIKRIWWRFHKPAHVAANHPRPKHCQTDIPAVRTPDHFDRIVVGCDLTFGGLKKTNDLACCSVWGSVGAAKYLIAIYWKKSTQLAQRDAIKELKRQYPDAKIVVEKAAAGAGVLELLASDGIDAIGVTPLGSKAERLDLVSPAIEAGNCYLPLGAAWLGDFVEELAGATKHDDAQDSTSISLSHLSSGSSAVAKLERHNEAMLSALLAMPEARMLGYDNRYDLYTGRAIEPPRPPPLPRGLDPEYDAICDRIAARNNQVDADEETTDEEDQDAEETEINSAVT